MKKPKYPDYEPIIPLTGAILREMADFLDVSYSVLYQIFRRNHTPGAAVQRRIERHAALPPTIWELPSHEANLRIYNKFRLSKQAQSLSEANIDGIL